MSQNFSSAAVVIGALRVNSHEDFFLLISGRESALSGEVRHIEEVEMLTQDGRANDSDSEEEEIFNARVDR